MINNFFKTLKPLDLRQLSTRNELDDRFLKDFYRGRLRKQLPNSEAIVNKINSEIVESILSKIKDLSKRELILIFSHGQGGGVQLFLDELTKLYSAKYDIVHFFPNMNGNFRDGYIMCIKLPDEELRFELPENISIALFENLIKVNIKHIIWNHTMLLSPILTEFLNQRNLKYRLIPYSVIAHDFYLLTPFWQLNHRGIELDIPSSDSETDSHIALFQSSVFHPKYNEISEYKNLIQNSNNFVAPSNFCMSKFVLRGWVSKGNNLVIPNLHSEIYDKQSVNNSFQLENLLDIKKIAVLGNIGLGKGSRVITDFLRIPRGDRATVLFAGTSDCGLEHIVDNYWGPYRPSDLDKIFEQEKIDAVWLPFQSEETYSYLLNEIYKRGLVVFTTKIQVVLERFGTNPKVKSFEVGTTADEWNTIFHQSYQNTILENEGLVDLFEENINSRTMYWNLI